MPLPSCGIALHDADTVVPRSDTDLILTSTKLLLEADEGSITPCELAESRRYRMPDRGPDRCQAEKRGSATTWKQQLYRAMVTVATTKGPSSCPSDDSHEEEP